MNPRYGEFDTYHMAASAIDEAVRNCVAVGADPSRICLLDNFCWGNCERPETLGSLVRAALACHDLALELGMPFVSGKDSLNNEFRHAGPDGQPVSLAIPPSLLISALGQMADVSAAVSMDLKEPGNVLFLVGLTRDELGGSHLALVQGLTGGAAPQVDVAVAKRTFAAMHRAISNGLVRSCHDLSEGGLAVALAEMAFAGGCGASVSLDRVPHDTPTGPQQTTTLLFSESNTRFLVETSPQRANEFLTALQGVPCAQIGEVTMDRLKIYADNRPGAAPLVDADLAELKTAWQAPLRW
jgi:phosphoribosylformylglycinamidine synthase